ncbi:hypothetical protein [Metallosphaera javensis (ex Sakai et al. 2022)]|uniref:hypothetical protein n=1 Tax=Metallosphaera javensis (ex Sakai et al. 2022) TaxID=2775498 RepID=UPI00258AF8B4|nr:MAG: hypothetical protein MjAS7_1643 [Metallosphaera javensis (ex Sakai et al. 2022)]
MRRYLKSRRAISGAVTALILVIVSVALALAVAIFAFGIFGTFNGAGSGVQVLGTPTILNVTDAANVNNHYYYYAVIEVTVKDGASTNAILNTIEIGSQSYTLNNSISKASASGTKASASGTTYYLPQPFQFAILNESVYAKFSTSINGVELNSTGAHIGTISDIPAGSTTTIYLVVDLGTTPPGQLSSTNVGSTVPITLQFNAGSLSPQVPVDAQLSGSAYTSS